MKYLPLLMLSLILSGCSLLSNDVATMWTNQPEFAAFVELFNTTQSKYKIEIAYRALPAQSLTAGETVPDIVIGSRLSSVNSVGQFSPLDQILGKNEIDPTLFYKNLLATGRYEGRQFLLPVSFDLPVVLFEQTPGAASDKQTLLTLENILTASKEFNKKSKDTFKVMGFSPLWSPNFLFSAAELLGADFHQTSRGNLAWDDQNLQKTIADLRGWVKDIDGGPQEEATFRDKYLYDPIYKLLESGRILYYSTTLTGYFDIPDAKRKTIDFRWLAEQNQIPVPENILFAGVPGRSRNKDAAYAFLKWFFKPETQSRLLELVAYDRIKTFGIGNGFSSLSVVNERDFPQHYPALLGKIPPADYLVYPKSLPTDWADLKSNVILPWMQSEVVAPAPQQKLEERLKAWRLQKPLQ
ncbi:MAG TPA: extracellular solute-binding protein [Spirochaetia bacterium]|nr:extracellular solute-binding protein [Spirochaetia bacterium]